MIAERGKSFAAKAFAAMLFGITNSLSSAMAQAELKPVAGQLTGTSITQKDNLLVVGFCTFAVLLVLWPIGLFLVNQWSYRKERILAVLARKGAVILYYKQFKPGAAILKDNPPPEGNGPFADEISKPYLAAFAKDFDTWYGRKYYIFPVLTLAFLTWASAVWAGTMLRAWATNGIGPGETLRALTASALAGGFVWVISDEIDRLRRRDFSTSDVYYYVFRILMAIPFAWAIAAVSVENKVLGLPGSIPLAFFLGAFPTRTLFTIARRFGSQRLNLGDSQDDNGNLELEKLQSIGKSNAERFKDEGVSTITTLAYADPIELTVRTNFDFNYVVDCISQALAWIYFEDDCVHLFEFSLRGAQEIISVTESADGTDGADDHEMQERAIQTIKDAAAKLNLSKQAFRSSLDQIAEDPYSQFLANVWG